jgi:eukaryotic-like serine/threonine-protein kinase
MTSEYQAGETIPGTQYRFVRALGAGGHGSVYEVEHKFLQASAVMKLLHPQLADQSDLAQRMTREARTLAKLRHPNIVEVRDGGITDETPARPFFVMEPLNGMSLRDLVRHMGGRGIGVLPALRILIGVLEGLQHAHRAGVIHRDVKPDNIYLHRTSTDVTVPKILDFGIAHLLMGQRSTGRHFLGTPRYAAPEQLRGESPTACTDIYAAGLVLHELLTGKSPFNHLKEIGALLQAHLSQELPPASSLSGDVPLVLDKFLASMLAKDAADRPPTAFAAAVSLREIRARVEAEQSGSMHAPEFKTEPTPMDNILVEASPEEIPFVTEVAFPQGANDTLPDPEPLFATLRDELRRNSERSPAHVLKTEPMAARPPQGAANRSSAVDRDARTNTAKEPAPEVRVGDHDTEPLTPDHPALVDTTPVDGAVRSPRDRRAAGEEASRVERTPGPLAIAPRAAPIATGERRRKRRRPVAVFAATLGVICAIGLPLALTMRGRGAPNASAPPPPAASESSPAATTATVLPPVAPLTSTTSESTAASSASSATAVVRAPVPSARATAGGSPPRPSSTARTAPPPRAARPAAGDPASVPFE